MLLSTTTDVLSEHFGMKKTVDILSKAGYDAADFSAFKEEFYGDAHDRDFYIEMRKYAEDKGLVFNQAHAPLRTSDIDAVKSEKIFKDVVNALKNASYLGAKIIVVHPNRHINYAKRENREAVFESNMEFYSRLIPYCEEFEIKVALENLWLYPQNEWYLKNGWGKIDYSVCGHPEEFVRYVDSLNNDCLVACLDIGHAMLVNEDAADFIKILGNKRLKALLVHDVDGFVDSHTLPFFGITDWDSVTKALAQIDYKGDITYEADGFLKHKPLELYPEYINLMVKTGRFLIDKVKKYS